MQRAPTARVFYNTAVTPSDVVTVEKQFHNVHISKPRRNRQKQPDFPFVQYVEPTSEPKPNVKGPKENQHPSDVEHGERKIQTNHGNSRPNHGWRRNRPTQQYSDQLPFSGPNGPNQGRQKQNQQHSSNHQPYMIGPNNNSRGNRQNQHSRQRNDDKSIRFSHQPSSYHKGGHSLGSSSGCSSSDSVQPQVILPIEEHERAAVEAIQETVRIIHEENERRRRMCKSLRKPTPHYECLEGAMLRREKIQHESYELHGDRHQIDDHERIYGHKREWVDVLREDQIRISRWLLKNSVEAQVKYDCEGEIEKLQIDDDDETNTEDDNNVTKEVNESGRPRDR